MTAIHAETALLPSGLAHDVRVTFASAMIETVEVGVAAQAGDEIAPCLLPAIANLHSHAFQRAMAGLAETRGPADDNFWSWRKEMYRFGLTMGPEHAEAVAAQLYMEMLEAGFCRVGEFHYLHHDTTGAPYANPAEMAERIVAASCEAGIGLTLLPVFYAHADFGGAPPLDGQRRFIHDLDAYARLMERAAALVAALPGGVLGIAPHSLRAVTPDELTAILPLARGGPIHIHVSEQTAEVDACLAWSGARPVEWLLDHAPVDERWCLIHATHMTEAECTAMAKSGATAGLCPLTEANLGDGIFPALAFLEEGGRFGVGSDSNIQISLAGELRQLEYAQRLAHRSRNAIARPGGSTGLHLLEEALAGGGRALGAPHGIAVAHPADLVTLDMSAVDWLPRAKTLDHFVFAEGIGIDGVWVGGAKRVADGRHVHRDQIAARFQQAMRDLLANGD
ncbi:formimidoylglutamate deiminase [Acuticoccus mangrovi]|uniref:Formimidoylglutamate deiminase n=1 Tax=Acuticoccus mangrovi TaxID=2796142 RepID=A0A934IM94_9HYPH|nr:formimidoylglutamate deiminase [Acuticoccus mangrovi]MBJ3776432.1 formimidoylglutamate deiminase [Acuticoccus mangrovi]